MLECPICKREITAVQLTRCTDVYCVNECKCGFIAPNSKQPITQDYLDQHLADTVYPKMLLSPAAIRKAREMSETNNRSKEEEIK